MILKPRNMEELIKHVQDLPAKQRKVIVLVGRHPNEGTNNLAVRYHKEWEKEGTVVVRIPPQWTPHGFWKQVEDSRKRLPQKEWVEQERDRLEKQLAETPDDGQVIAALKANRIRSPVVNFHSTHINSRIDSSEPYLLIEPSSRRGGKTVEFFYRGRPAAFTAQRRAGNAPRLKGDTHGQLTKEYLYHSIITREDLKEFKEHCAERFQVMLGELSRKKPWWRIK